MRTGALDYFRESRLAERPEFFGENPVTLLAAALRVGRCGHDSEGEGEEDAAHRAPGNVTFNLERLPRR
jgi:hypothetical protein